MSVSSTERGVIKNVYRRDRNPGRWCKLQGNTHRYRVRHYFKYRWGYMDGQFYLLKIRSGGSLRDTGRGPFDGGGPPDKTRTRRQRYKSIARKSRNFTS